MRQMCCRRINSTLVLVSAIVVIVQGLAIAQEADVTPDAQDRKTVEPVFRVSKLPTDASESEKSAIEAEIAAEPILPNHRPAYQLPAKPRQRRLTLWMTHFKSPRMDSSTCVLTSTIILP